MLQLEDAGEKAASKRGPEMTYRPWACLATNLQTLVVVAGKSRESPCRCAACWRGCEAGARCTLPSSHSRTAARLLPLPPISVFKGPSPGELASGLPRLLFGLVPGRSGHKIGAALVRAIWKCGFEPRSLLRRLPEASGKGPQPLPSGAGQRRKLHSARDDFQNSSGRHRTGATLSTSAGTGGGT
jgi:hypothetical protein